MIPRLGLAAVVLLVAPACGGDEYSVDVHLAADLRCDESVVELRSVGIEVVRETSSGLEEVPDLGDCSELAATRRVADLLEPFRAGDVIVAGVPADDRTLLRFIGYTSATCLRDTERVCGITCPPVRAGELPEEGVVANFVCEGRLLQNRDYLGCVNLEQLTEEARGNICAR